jgi:hypothetical protein
LYRNVLRAWLGHFEALNRAAIFSSVIARSPTMTRTRRATLIHGHAPAPRNRFFLPRSGPEKNRDYKSSRSTKGAKMMQSMLNLIYSEFLKSTFPDAELQA